MARTAIYCTLDSQDAAIDEVISGCNGDMRGALKALMLVNEHQSRNSNNFTWRRPKFRSTNIAQKSGCIDVCCNEHDTGLNTGHGIT